jgi:hypothetical protein
MDSFFHHTDELCREVAEAWVDVVGVYRWELLCLYCHDNAHARQQVADASAEPTPGGEREPPYTYRPFAGLDDVLKRHT